MPQNNFFSQVNFRADCRGAGRGITAIFRN
jgi:hypothetical protein